MTTRRISFPSIVLLTVAFLLRSALAQPYGVVSPTSINFGQVLVGQTSPQQRITLKNTGDEKLTISNISISGNFALPVNKCGSGVKPGTHCNVYVTFTPHALETETGTLTFTDNASNSPQTVSLSGVGSNTAPTVTSLTASPNRVYAGDPITFTATVTSLGGGVVPDGEQVYFTGHLAGLGYASLQNGVAVLTTTVAPANGGAIVAQYAGDQTFNPSEGKTPIRVDRWPTTVTLTSTPNPSVYHQPINYTANITSGSPYPIGGTIWAFCNTMYVRVDDGVAGQTCDHVNAGSYELRASYRGDANNDKGVSAPYNQVVNPSTTTTSIKSSRNPFHQGQSVTFSVVVSAPWTHLISGSVTFASGGNTLGTVELKNSRGSIATSSLPVGQDTITATYTPGNGNFLGSSDSLVQTVQ